MCEPVTIMTALAVASTAANIVTQVKSAKAQQKAINEQYAEVVQQNNESATSQLNERLREQRREQGRIKVAAGESGLQLSGSIAGLLQDSLMQAGMAEDSINVNRDNANTAAGREAGSMMSRVEQPTVLGAGLQLATAGMQGYSAGVGIQNANAAAKAKAVA